MMVSKRFQRGGGRSRFTRLGNADYAAAIAVGIPSEPATCTKGALFDMRDVAFCLVENERGEVLFVQRAYGKEKGKWSLPGGLVDRGESSRHAAYRETREETGIIVKITHRLFAGNTRPIKVFVGRQVGGRLRFQRKECLDVRWRNPQRVRPEDLAFGGDRKALRLWADIKSGRAKPERDYPTFPIWLKSFLSNSSMVFQPLSNYGPFLRVPSYNNSMICHFAVRCRRHHGGT